MRQSGSENERREIKMSNDEQLTREDKPNLGPRDHVANSQPRQMNLPYSEETENDKPRQELATILLNEKEVEQQRPKKQKLKKLHPNVIKQRKKMLQREYYDYLLHRQYSKEEIEKIQREAMEIFYYNKLK